MECEIVTNVEIENEISPAVRKRINFKNWDAKNKDRRKEWRRIWKSENKDKIKISQRKTQLKKKYGITLEQYDAMLLKQDGHCVFCDRTPEEERYGVLSVDHCHKTGRIRGLLCMVHNRAIGAFGDDEEGLLKAIAYIKEAI